MAPWSSSLQNPHLVEKLRLPDKRIEHRRDHDAIGGYHAPRYRIPLMPEFQPRQLPAECKPLLDKFYRAHRSHMRVPAGARCWVAGRAEIVAGLCLSGVADGYWLTGLLVAPSQRDQGLATRLISQALSASEGPVWLFCEPKISAFYRRLGFGETTVLPEPLASRLQRYNRNKTLVALWHDNERFTCPKKF